MSKSIAEAFLGNVSFGSGVGMGEPIFGKILEPTATIRLEHLDDLIERLQGAFATPMPASDIRAMIMDGRLLVNRIPLTVIMPPGEAQERDAG